jgi:hypothetical protein
VNGDGFGDVVAGAPTARGNIGCVYVYLGSAMGLSPSASVTLVGPDGVGGFGASIAGAGDVNGDGFSDLVVGAPGVDMNVGRVYLFLGSATGLPTSASAALLGMGGMNAGFGEVSSAGDVNGDGRTDIAILAPRANGEIGRGYMHLGTPAGLASSPSVLTINPEGMPRPSGYSMAGAGDVNADGYQDLVVGDQDAAGGLGRAYVFYGGAAGLATSPSVTLTAMDGTHNYFGRAVAGAGDVNGDSVADLVVGSSQVYLYLGSTTGLPATASIALPAPDGMSSAFGSSVASAPALRWDPGRRPARLRADTGAWSLSRAWIGGLAGPDCG